MARRRSCVLIAPCFRRFSQIDSQRCRRGRRQPQPSSRVPSHAELFFDLQFLKAGTNFFMRQYFPRAQLAPSLFFDTGRRPGLLMLASAGTVAVVLVEGLLSFRRIEGTIADRFRTDEVKK